MDILDPYLPTAQQDAMAALLEMDKIDYAKVVLRVIGEKFESKCGTISFVNYDSLFIESDDLLFGVSRIVVKVNQNLTSSCFHLGIQMPIPSLTKNRITILNSWYEIEEVIDDLIQHKKHKKSKYCISKSKLWILSKWE